MKFYIKSFQDITASQWDDFVDRTYGGWLWHTSGVIKAKSTWPNHENMSFAVVDSSNHIVAILPIFLIHFKVLKALKSSSLDNIGGWLISPEFSPMVVPILMEQCQKIVKENSSHQIQINFEATSLYYKKDPIYFSGLQGKTAYITVIDLEKNEQTVWESISNHHKRKIKTAETQGLEFREAATADVDIYYKMHIETYEKSSLNPHPIAYFKEIFEECISKGYAYIGCILKDGNPLAMVNYGVYKDIAVYWTGASTKEAYKQGVNHFLHWSMIKKMKERGIKHMDLGEAFVAHSSTKIQGISNFKTGFGGDLHPCYKYAQQYDTSAILMSKIFHGITK